MKKTIILSCILTLLFTASAFSTEVTAGITYDTHSDSFLMGTEFSLKEDFEDNSSLLTELSYINSGSYHASLVYNKSLGIAILSGGLNYSINKTEIIPFITGGAGVIFRDFSFLASGGLNLNHENVFSPDTYTCNADVLFDTGESIIDLSFLFSRKETEDGFNSKIGGGLAFTAYKEGAPVEIDILTDVLYVNNTIDDINGLAVDAGIGINVYLPFMDIKLKTMVDAMNPELPDGTDFPFTIGLSTGFTL